MTLLLQLFWLAAPILLAGLVHIVVIKRDGVAGAAADGTRRGASLPRTTDLRRQQDAARRRGDDRRFSAVLGVARWPDVPAGRRRSNSRPPIPRNGARCSASATLSASCRTASSSGRSELRLARWTRGMPRPAVLGRRPTRQSRRHPAGRRTGLAAEPRGRRRRRRHDAGAAPVERLGDGARGSEGPGRLARPRRHPVTRLQRARPTSRALVGRSKRSRFVLRIPSVNRVRFA